MCGSIKTCFQTIVIAFALVFKHLRNIWTNEAFSNKIAHYVSEVYLWLLSCLRYNFMCLIEFSCGNLIFISRTWVWFSSASLNIESMEVEEEQLGRLAFKNSRLPSIQGSSKVTLLCTPRWLNQSKLLRMENMWLVKKWWGNRYSITACTSANELYEGTGKGVFVFGTCEGVDLQLHVYLASLAEWLLDPASSNWSVFSSKHFVTVSSLRCYAVQTGGYLPTFRDTHFCYQKSSIPETSVNTKLLCALSQKIADQERKHNISSCYVV
jgi:hypothetical protein